jgi:putative tryptophan/tyrosine transport system substrate-binding protein
VKRREFITLLGGAAAAWPLAARGQQPVTKPVRIGVLANEWWPPIESLREGLRERGYVEGQNLQFEYRWAQDRNERHPALAAELVALPVDVIVTWGTPAALAAKRATSAVPIVMGRSAIRYESALSRTWPVQAETSPALPRSPSRWRRNDWSC